MREERRKPSLANLHRTCPQCHAKLKGNQGDVRTSGLAMVIYLLAAFVTLLWILFTPVYVVPTGPGGVLVAGGYYLLPGALVGAFAARIPNYCVIKCHRCPWHEKKVLGKRRLE